VVLRTFSPARAWRPAVVARLARTLNRMFKVILLLGAVLGSALPFIYVSVPWFALYLGMALAPGVLLLPLAPTYRAASTKGQMPDSDIKASLLLVVDPRLTVLEKAVALIMSFALVLMLLGVGALAGLVLLSFLIQRSGTSVATLAYATAA